ncbi:hypothetical protein, partial [Streptomyces scabiei]|uniref:hypothetical protein n=1 Tax=Streptomyces scabiei TaxID=1930 RepID=UPI0029AE404B
WTFVYATELGYNHRSRASLLADPRRRRRAGYLPRPHTAAPQAAPVPPAPINALRPSPGRAPS